MAINRINLQTGTRDESNLGNGNFAGRPLPRERIDRRSDKWTYELSIPAIRPNNARPKNNLVCNSLQSFLPRFVRLVEAEV
ncbi:protein of unknown function [Streptomyces sp. KY75]|nr:protein of unknown function [Streptomyces sp. KY75]CAD5990103.1 protein of unknown function [Streptomyces sp. KY70]